MEDRSKPGFIYVAETGDRKVIKIGFTQNPRQRAAATRKDLGAHYDRNVGVRFLLYLDGKWQREQEIHASLADCRIASGREWYRRDDPRVQQFIRAHRGEWKRWKFTERPGVLFHECLWCGDDFRQFGGGDPLCSKRCAENYRHEQERGIYLPLSESQMAIVRRSESLIQQIGTLLDIHATIEKDAIRRRVKVHQLGGIMAHDPDEGAFYCPDLDSPYTADGERA